MGAKVATLVAEFLSCSVHIISWLLFLFKGVLRHLCLENFRCLFPLG